MLWSVAQPAGTLFYYFLHAKMNNNKTFYMWFKEHKGSTIDTWSSVSGEGDQALAFWCLVCVLKTILHSVRPQIARSNNWSQNEEVKLSGDRLTGLKHFRQHPLQTWGLLKLETVNSSAISSFLAKSCLYVFFSSAFTIVIMSSSVSFPLKHFWRVSDLSSAVYDKPNTNRMPKKPPMTQPMRVAWLMPLS